MLELYSKYIKGLRHLLSRATRAARARRAGKSVLRRHEGRRSEMSNDLDTKLKASKKEARDLRRHLTKLTTQVAVYVGCIDKIMRGASTPERGKQIATLSNSLEFANDQARHFGLGAALRPAPPTPRERSEHGTEETK